VTGQEWRPDPSGKHQYRLWDGAKFTDNVSDNGVAGVDAYDPLAPPAPPVAVPAAPQQIVVIQKRSGCLKAALIGGGVVVVIGILIAVLIGVAANKVVNDQKAHAITQAQYDAVQIGETKTALIAQLGKQPADAQSFETKGVLTSDNIKSSCIYYNSAADTFTSPYQFCFDGNDKLDTKNQY
jgi:hypothetical protein